MDINILCVKQKGEIKYNKQVFLLESLNKKQTDGCIYQDNWFIYNSIIGHGYNLYSAKIDHATYDIIDYEETDTVADYFRYLFHDDKSPINGIVDFMTDVKVVFNSELLDDFKELLLNVIKCSQIKTCIIFFRIQACCPERYVGRISLKQFLEKLKCGQIYLNTAYIISEADYD